MATQYRIAEWWRYEVDTKGREWKPGAPLWVGPLRFIRWKINGRKVGLGYRRMKKAAGRSRTLMVLGLFGKLLEIAGDANREQRNQLGTAEEIAEAIDAPLTQVEYGLTILTADGVGWVEAVPAAERSEASEVLAQPNQTKPNLTEPNQTARARTRGDGSGAAGAASVGADANSWATTKQLVHSTFGADSGLGRAMDTIGNSLLSSDARALDQAAQTIRELVGEATSRPKVGNRKGYFVAALKKRFRCLK